MTVAFASGGMLPDTASLVAAIAGLVAAVAGLVGACASLILARLAVRQNEQRERVEEQKRKAEEEKLEAEKRKREAEKDAQEAEEAASEAEIRKGELEIQLETIAPPVLPEPGAGVPPNAERTDYYFTFGLGRGTDNRRSWEEARRYGFVCAGGGTRWSRPLNLLEPGGRVWVLVPQRGYVGVGLVAGRPQPASRFRVQTDRGETPVLDAVTQANYHREYVDNEEMCEWFVPVNWMDTKPLEQAVWMPGMFAIPATAARPTSARWRATLETLRQEFPGFGDG